VSHELERRGVDHVVLERGRIGQSWRDRWDSFCLVTPNWSVQLPDGTYDESDPDGFMSRDEIVAFLERSQCIQETHETGPIRVQALRSITATDTAMQIAFRGSGSLYLRADPRDQAAS
jgi:cation diffusion facilitator CzcD-associated flavoprotein CzcO